MRFPMPQQGIAPLPPLTHQRPRQGAPGRIQAERFEDETLAKAALLRQQLRKQRRCYE